MGFGAVDVPHDCGVQGVGESISEDLREVEVCHVGEDIVDDLFSGRRNELAAAFVGPLIGQSKWSSTEMRTADID